MAKRNRSSKKLEAIKRSEEINRMLEDSTIESEALLNSAGESRPSYEAHVLDLLEKPGLTPPSSERRAKKQQGKKLARKKR